MRKLIIIISSILLVAITGMISCNSSKQPSKHNEGIVDTTASGQENLKWRSQ